MAVLAEPSIEVADDRLAKRNALVLAVAQALAGGNLTVIVATGGIAGSILAPDPVLATLPISVMVVGMWLGTLPVGVLAKAFGRRFALQTGSVVGVLSGLIAALAMLRGSFLLLLVGALCGGLYAAAHQSYRFAATDTASAHFRAKAVSWVLAGGVFGAVIGPQLVILTKDVWPPYLFTGTYLAQAACAFLAGAVLILLKLPKPVSVQTFADGRPLAEIARNPRFIIAVVCGLASYGVMNLMMTSAPLAMVMCNHLICRPMGAKPRGFQGFAAPASKAGVMCQRCVIPSAARAGAQRGAFYRASGLLLARYKFEYRRTWARRADTPVNFSSQAARATASRPCSTVTIGSTTRVRSTGARSMSIMAGSSCCNGSSACASAVRSAGHDAPLKTVD